MCRSKVSILKIKFELGLSITDPSRPSAQRENEWTDEQDARDPTKRERHRLRVSVGISGWLSSPSDVSQPWEVIDSAATEPFALRFELDAMLRLGNSLQDVLFSYAWDGVAYTVVSRTLLGALYAGLWPLGLIKAASVLDNPFSVALARADKAGKVLAHALIDGVQGKRPVSLIGYSVGARVIYSCLLELAEQHVFGLVESVTLMGTPAALEHDQWRQMRSVVSGRMVNVYSTEDYVLGFLYRSTKLQMDIAGLQEVQNVQGIENMDASKLISGHDQYRFMVGKILSSCGMGDIDIQKVSEQERALESAEKRKQQIKRRARERQKAEGEAQYKSSPPKQALYAAREPTTGPTSKAIHQSDFQILSKPQTQPPNLPSATQSSEATKDPFLSQVSTSNNNLMELTRLSINTEETATNTTAARSSAMRLTKSGPDVNVTEVLVIKGNGGDESDKSEGEGDSFSQHWDADKDAYEVSSDFGDDDLAMVEPEPMDENDFGLM